MFMYALQLQLCMYIYATHTSTQVWDNKKATATQQLTFEHRRCCLQTYKRANGQHTRSVRVIAIPNRAAHQAGGRKAL